MKNNNVANFFWVGNISYYEVVSIKSFLKNGFIVNLWIYKEYFNHNNYLEGLEVNIKDASDIVDVKYLFKFTQNNQKKNITSFSNFFRYTLIEKEYGWWFDLDCICLKNVSKFIELSNNNKIILGREYDSHIGSSVMYVADKNFSTQLLNEVNRRIINKNFNFFWGEIGPNMISDVVRENNLLKKMQNKDLFYAIKASDFHKLFSNKHSKEIQNLLSNSFTVHIWNEMILRNNINKNLIPPKNSYLYNLFKIYTNISEKKIYSNFLLNLRFFPVISSSFKLSAKLKRKFKNDN